jgi:general stress protein YciG
MLTTCPDGMRARRRRRRLPTGKPSDEEKHTMANNQGQNQGGKQRSGTSNRGFASMDEQQQREIARLGGAAVSENREHMAAIGRKGGEASAESRQNARARALDAAASVQTGGTPGDQRVTTRQVDDGGARGSTSSRGRNDEDLGGNRVMYTSSARSDDDSGDRNLSGRARSDDSGNRNLSSRGRNDEDGGRRLSGSGRQDEPPTNSGRGGNPGNRGGNR